MIIEKMFNILMLYQWKESVAVFANKTFFAFKFFAIL